MTAESAPLARVPAPGLQSEPAHPGSVESSDCVHRVFARPSGAAEGADPDSAGSRLSDTHGAARPGLAGTPDRRRVHLGRTGTWTDVGRTLPEADGPRDQVARGQKVGTVVVDDLTDDAWAPVAVESLPVRRRLWLAVTTAVVVVTVVGAVVWVARRSKDHRQGVSAVAAVDATDAANSAHVSFEMSSSMIPSLKVTGDGVVSFVSGDYDVQVKVGDMEDVEGEQRRVNGVDYIRLPLSSPSSTPSWIKLDGTLNAAMSSAAPAAFAARFDPRGTLTKVRQAATQETTIGVETIDGVATTHERLTVAIPPNPLVSATTETVDLWIDSQQRLRRIDTDTGDEHSTTSFRDFGTPVNVEAPAAADMKDLNSLVTDLAGDLPGEKSQSPELKAWIADHKPVLTAAAHLLMSLSSPQPGDCGASLLADFRALPPPPGHEDEWVTVLAAVDNTLRLCPQAYASPDDQALRQQYHDAESKIGPMLTSIVGFGILIGG